MALRIIIAVWVLAMVGAFIYTSVDKFTYPLEMYWDAEDDHTKGGFFYVPKVGRLEKTVWTLQLPLRSVTLWTTYYDNKNPKVARIEKQAAKAFEDARHKITLRTSNGWYFEYDDRKGLDAAELKNLSELADRVNKEYGSYEKRLDYSYRRSMDVDVQCEELTNEIRTGNRLD